MRIDFSPTKAARGQLAEALNDWSALHEQEKRRLEDAVTQSMQEAALGHVLFSTMRSLRPRGRDLLEHCDYLERRLSAAHPYGPAHSSR